MSCDIEDTCVCRSDRVCVDPTCRTCPTCGPSLDDDFEYDGDGEDFHETAGGTD